MAKKVPGHSEQGGQGGLSFGGTWTVFGPVAGGQAVPDAAELAECPKALVVHGKRLSPVTMKAAGGRIDLAKLYGKPQVGRAAYVFIPVTAPAAGEYTIGIGADWWFQAWVDGKVAGDTLGDGNMASPPSKQDNALKVKLAAGKHVLAVRIISGSGGMQLAVGKIENDGKDAHGTYSRAARRPVVAFVGGGSCNWMPHIIRDVILMEEMRDADIRLLDINPRNAELVASVGRRYAKEWKIGATFLPTSNPARALEGASAVVITISTGGLDAMSHDLRIPQRYGIYQTVGDTVGPGGWARGLRNIPVFAALSEQIRKHAPGAFILNYTNPMGTLTATLARVSKQPVVGLCHGLFENYATMQGIFGLKSESELRMKYAGLNHFFWILDFTVKGKPGYPLLKDKLRGGKRLNDLVKDAFVDSQGHSSRQRLVASELYEEFGYLPYFGDRHISEFFSRYLAPDRSRLKTYALEQTTIAMRKSNLAGAQQRARDLASGKTPLGKRRTRETAADIIAARVANREFVDVMNLPNIGQISNLPRGVVVETPGIVNATGFSPVCCGELPPSLLTVTMPHAVNQKLILEAGLEGDMAKAFDALVNDPICSHLTVPKIRKMGRELLLANKAYLPQFFGKK